MDVALSNLPYPVPRMTAIIGGGGKTTLLYTLGRHLAARGASVLVTTTTHLAWPHPAEVAFCSPDSAEGLIGLARPGTVLQAGYRAEEARMTGLSPALLTAAAETFDHILVEADGARRLPLKFHRAFEPCIPAGTGLVIQVAGLSALGRPAGETVHGQKLSGLCAEDCVTPQDIVRLVLRAFEHMKLSCPAVCLLNQADTPALRQQGGAIAAVLRAAGYPVCVGALEKGVLGCWL